MQKAHVLDNNVKLLTKNSPTMNYGACTQLQVPRFATASPWHTLNIFCVNTTIQCNGKEKGEHAQAVKVENCHKSAGNCTVIAC